MSLLQRIVTTNPFILFYIREIIQQLNTAWQRRCNSCSSLLRFHYSASFLSSTLVGWKVVLPCNLKQTNSQTQIRAWQAENNYAAFLQLTTSRKVTLATGKPWICVCGEGGRTRGKRSRRGSGVRTLWSIWGRQRVLALKNGPTLLDQLPTLLCDIAP